MSSSPHPSNTAYLVELLDRSSELVQDCDVFAKLELAVEDVLKHLKQTPSSPIRADVSLDEDGQVDGIGFFDEDEEPLAHITVYHLERDDGCAIDSAISSACSAAPTLLSAQLNALLIS